MLRHDEPACNNNTSTANPQGHGGTGDPVAKPSSPSLPPIKPQARHQSGNASPTNTRVEDTKAAKRRPPHEQRFCDEDAQNWAPKKPSDAQPILVDVGGPWRQGVPPGRFLELNQAAEISGTWSGDIKDLFISCKGPSGGGDMPMDVLRSLGKSFFKGAFIPEQFLVWWDFNVHQHIRISAEEFALYLADLAWRSQGGDRELAQSKGMPLVLRAMRERASA